VRAIAYNKTGDADVLHLIERPEPEPKAGEVVVRVAVSGVNPTDWKSRKGSRAGQPLAFAEVVPNQDGAGTIVAVGVGVDRARVGQRVWLWEAAFQRADGTAQELVAIPARQAVPLPDRASFDLGASLGIPALTAHRCLTVLAEGPGSLGPGALNGRTVLVAGGAGAVGHAAIELAVWAGATVITTVSSVEKEVLAKAAGAHHVVNYRTSDAADEIRRLAPDGVDLVVEVSSVANASLNQSVLARNGTVAIYASGTEDLAIEVRPAMVANARYQFVMVYTVPPTAKDQAVKDVAAAVEAGALRVGTEAGLPTSRFALSETAAAHDAVENNAVGKVLIDVDSGSR
jgi:NADPH2:quinone reductase